jgi:Domain of unknown function (DUF932)
MTAQSTLCLHRGAGRVSKGELARYQPPPATATWFPVAHAAVLDTACTRLTEAGYTVQSMDLAVSKDGHRFFGTLNLDTVLVPGVHLAVGLRNSTDKSFPLGFAAGNRCFVCDNLAFAAATVVRKRHSKRGEARWGNAITTCIASLRSFAEMEAQRVKLMQHEEITEDRAHALILKAHLRDIVAHRHLEPIAKQWAQPAYDEWGGSTLWRLFNCMTYILADVAHRNPSDYAARTIKLNQLCSPFGGGSGPGPTSGGAASSRPGLAA